MKHIVIATDGSDGGLAAVAPSPLIGDPCYQRRLSADLRKAHQVSKPPPPAPPT